MKHSGAILAQSNEAEKTYCTVLSEYEYSNQEGKSPPT
jgi:hypothetical protein